MNESKRTSQVLKRFRELYPDGIAWKFNDRIARSRPDSLFLLQVARFVEFKMEGNQPTPGQMLELQKLAKAGHWTAVVWFTGKQFYLRRVLEHGFELPPLDVFYSVDELCHFLA